MNATTNKGRHMNAALENTVKWSRPITVGKSKMYYSKCGRFRVESYSKNKRYYSEVFVDGEWVNAVRGDDHCIMNVRSAKYRAEVWLSRQ